MVADANLRFAVLALREQLIDERQFAHVCSVWAEDPSRSIAALLSERSWVSEAEREALQQRIDRHEAEGLAAPEQPTLTLGPSEASLGLDLDDLDLGGLPLTVRERITLRGLHSSGGIGEVWRAYDEILGREIALKRLKTEQAAQLEHRARFFREARITGQLDHPGVVPVYDFSAGHGDEHCFYTMRFLRGRTLSEVIEAFHAEREPGEDMVSGAFLQLLGYFVNICNTMAFAHSRGIVHRDLNGNNVIVGDYGEVVVLDWGLAKRVSTRAGACDGDEGERDESDSQGSRPADSLTGMRVTETLQGERLGTPAFMAPEQALGQIDRIDHRTDVYGLCALLYDMLTGQPPFVGDDALAVMDAVARAPVRSPRELVPEVPSALEAICVRGLAKSRAQRWPDVSSLASAVQRWIGALVERKQTERERERFFDLSSNLLAIVDGRGKIVQSNAAWHARLGWTLEARRGQPFAAFVVDGEGQREAAERVLAELDPEGQPSELELRMLHAAGETRWIHFQARSLPANEGRYLVGRDVTERRQTEQTFAGLVESAPDATCVIDASGTIVLVNAQLERLFGYSRAELVGEGIEVLVPEPLRERHVGHVRRYVANPKVRLMGSGLALTGQTKSGAIIPIEVSLGPVETEAGTLVACALRSRAR